jgi:hypothetical protein
MELVNELTKCYMYSGPNLRVSDPVQFYWDICVSRITNSWLVVLAIAISKSKKIIIVTYICFYWEGFPHFDSRGAPSIVDPALNVFKEHHRKVTATSYIMRLRQITVTLRKPWICGSIQETSPMETKNLTKHTSFCVELLPLVPVINIFSR